MEALNNVEEIGGISKRKTAEAVTVELNGIVMNRERH